MPVSDWLGEGSESRPSFCPLDITHKCPLSRWGSAGCLLGVDMVADKADVCALHLLLHPGSALGEGSSEEQAREGSSTSHSDN